MALTGTARAQLIQAAPADDSNKVDRYFLVWRTYHSRSGNGDPKLIGTFFSIYVWDKDFNELTKISRNGRIYAPVVCADLEGDGIYEIVYGSTNGEVGAYEWRTNTLTPKNGWPVSTCDAGQCPEVRGLAAGGLYGDGTIEVVATTNQTDAAAQVFVFNPSGTLYQPSGISWRGWPRYNSPLTGADNDSDLYYLNLFPYPYIVALSSDNFLCFLWSRVVRRNSPTAIDLK